MSIQSNYKGSFLDKFKAKFNLNNRGNLFLKYLYVLSIITLAIHLVVSFIVSSVVSSIFATFSVYILLINLILFLTIKKNIRIQVIIVILFLFSIELYLKYIKRENLSYSEKNGGFFSFYASSYKLHNLWPEIIKYSPQDGSSYVVDKKAEFEYSYQYNSDGYRGKEIKKRKKKNEYRILCLGDSWTEGIGAPSGYSYPEILGSYLKHYSKNINVINLGCSGSDPIIQYMALKESHIHLNPDMIILTVNNSDIDDIIRRGGLERIESNRYKRGPWWEFIYATSPVFRRIIHGAGYNYLLDKSEDSYVKAATELTISINKIAEYCKLNKIEFVLVFVPDQNEMKNVRKDSNGDIYYFLSKDLWMTLEKLIDENRIEIIFLQENYIQNGINPVTASTYYWQLDYHHNEKGYTVMAQSIYNELIKRDTIFHIKDKDN